MILVEDLDGDVGWDVVFFDEVVVEIEFDL